MAKKHKHKKKQKQAKAQQLSVKGESTLHQHTIHASSSPAGLHSDVLKWLDVLKPTDTPFLTRMMWGLSDYSNFSTPPTRIVGASTSPPKPLTEQDELDAVAEWERMLQEFNAK